MCDTTHLDSTLSSNDILNVSEDLIADLVDAAIEESTKTLEAEEDSGINISQKNRNYSVGDSENFKNIPNFKKKLPGNKVQNLCFGRLFVHFWANFWSQKEKST